MLLNLRAKPIRNLIPYLSIFKFNLASLSFMYRILFGPAAPLIFSYCLNSILTLNKQTCMPQGPRRKIIIQTFILFSKNTY